MRLDILTLFPEIFAPLFTSIPGRAQLAGLVEVHLHPLRRWGEGRHRLVDDVPFGGGPGMVLRPGPLAAALADIQTLAPERARVVYLTPQGRPLDQQRVLELSRLPRLLLLCGHYEGIDERVRETLVDEEISIGDYVLSGGELAAMVVADAVIRVIPGVIDPESAQQESFMAGLLDHPHYTRPAVFAGRAVPEVLTSGDHARIEAWRRQAALERTLQRRPDLLEKAALTPEERRWLESRRQGCAPHGPVL
ncbi:MAG TPA: tRNA (guanosine(37)-N1)-methyltransferase TrmD [Candidatus Nitrosotenuis sp.]|jgi:tRNA (guanine37-N1)-methyltransferase|nr:tRNA (guanosine(37)-N1)-methyltransferase TrmD [Candidatus Nitrosotenuis sp.]